MTIQITLIIISTAILMSIGQLLFKMGAETIEAKTVLPYLYQVMTSPVLISACVLYAFTILLWIWVLRQVPLSKAYPFTAIAYILTPILGYLFFDEKINIQLIVGTFFLLIGIIVCTTATASNYVNH